MGRPKHGEKVAMRHVGKEQTIHAERQERERDRAARTWVTTMLSGAAFGGTWRGPKQPGRRFGPAPVGSSGRRLAADPPLDQRAREDRYRRQTGRLNRSDDDAEAWIDLMPPTRRAEVLGLTPKQLRRSEHKANRAESRMLTAPGRR